MNRFSKQPYRRTKRKHSGVVLLITLVLLVVLATVGYTLSSHIAVQRHRYRYIIDYANARYACDSALKYALATLEEIEPELISRPNEPDFSDLFALTEAEYKELLAQYFPEKSFNQESNLNYTEVIGDNNEINDINNIANVSFENFDSFDFGTATIRGPYGPPWPLVSEPAEFQVGNATVKIEIEDENAKYPAGWMLLDGPEIQREIVTGFETFCEWMGMNSDDIDSLEQQFEEIGQIKPFKTDFKAVTKTVTRPIRTRTTSSRSRSRRTPRTRRSTTTISAAEQIAKQTVDFARLFHSSLIDIELLAKPTVISESRKESALKYMGMWASRKVNVNTAPRHVLEAALVFAGPSDAPKIAEEIIQQRRIKPFSNIDELKKSLFGYSGSIDKCEQYITTTSTSFTVKINAVSGVAEASAIAAITIDNNKAKPVAVICD